MADVVVPKLNNNDTEYVLVGWLIEDGQAVKAGDPVAEVETSKSTVELVCESDGVFQHLLPVDGECRPGDVIARVFATEEERRAYATAGGDGPADGGPSAPTHEREPVLTDSARALAAELGVSAEQLRGLGTKVVKLEDVERLVGAGSAPAAAATPEPPSGTVAVGAPEDSTAPRHSLPRAQRAVGAVVTESHQAIPAAFAAIKIYLDEAIELARDVTRRTRRLVGVPELLIKAIAGLREEFPLFFATGYDGSSVRLAEASHVGVTVDVGTGLFIPVVRDAQGLSCGDIADAMIDFRTKAMENAFREPDLTGGNIVVSLHNDADIVLAYPIVFPGQTCVVSLGGVQRELVLDEGGSVQTRRVATVGVAYDHRVVNGRDAVQFLQEIKKALESPAPLQDG